LQLVEAADHLARGGKPEEIGDQVIELKETFTLQPNMTAISYGQQLSI